MWIWIIFGAAFSVAIVALVLWLRKNNVSITWYEWLIGIAGVLLLVFTIQNTWGSLYELEPTAAMWMWIVTGLPAIILMILAGSLVWRRSRSTA